MHKMMELRDMLCDELEKFTDVGTLSASHLDTVNKLTHSIKSIDTILAMEGYNYYSGARGRMNARRDSRGRYSGSVYGRYSHDYSGDTKETIEKIEKMLDELKRNA